MTKKKGFTIIELTVVVALLLILFAISYKLVFGAVQRSRDQANASALSNINSMYRMASAFIFIENNSEGDGARTIALPTSSPSSTMEKAIESRMLDAFADLAHMKYILTDTNGIAHEGGVTITYYPYEDKPHEYYQWVDGVISRTYDKTTQQLK